MHILSSYAKVLDNTFNVKKLPVRSEAEMSELFMVFVFSLN